MLDHLSHGRLDIGVGTGVSPHEFAGASAWISTTARDGFEEMFEILHQGLTQDRARSITASAVRHRRAARWCCGRCSSRMPPLWYGLRSDYGHALAARYGMNAVTLGPRRAHRQVDRALSRGVARARGRARRASARRRGRRSSARMRAVFVADSDARGGAHRGPAYEQWFESLCWLWKENGAFPPIALSPDFAEARASGALVAGAPRDGAAASLVEQARSCGFNYLVLQLAFGSLGHRAGNALARALARRGDAGARAGSTVAAL